MMEVYVSSLSQRLSSLQTSFLSVLFGVIRVLSTSVRTLSHSWAKLRWTPSSKRWLIKLDKKLRTHIGHKNKGLWIPVVHNGKWHDVWTVIVEGDNNSAIPVVLIHGMGGGSNMFLRNIDSLAERRDVYLLDMPGFGLSSRPELRKKHSDDGQMVNTDENDVEHFYTEILEKWFKTMKLDKVILLGHSYGAFLSSVYSMAYPTRVQHLILADPWGFPPIPEKPRAFKSFKIRILIFLISKLHNRLTVFSPIRALGPLGPAVLWAVRPDLHDKYAVGSKDDTTFFEYIYACNTADLPSGEKGFNRVSYPSGYAYKPILERVNQWSPDLGVSFIYGEDSWVNNQSGFMAKSMRSCGHTDVQIIKGSGHHVQADRPGVFNTIVRQITEAVDCGEVLSSSLLEPVQD